MADNRQKCKYGKQCYRKNADHLRKFYHEVNRKNHKGFEEDGLEPPLKKVCTEIAESENNVIPEKGRIGTLFAEDNSDVDMNELMLKNFAIHMPEDFFDLWELCKVLKPECPQDALKKDLFLELVGPYDILARKKIDRNEEISVPCALHYRYYYDPPEFVTIIKGDDSSGFHIGYYRDAPEERPVMVACNEAKVSYEFKILGNNIFAALRNHIKDNATLKNKKGVQGLINDIDEAIKRKQYSLETNPPSIKQRRKKVVAKTFHKMGIVVPLDENDVGYRDLQMSNGELKRILTDIVEDKHCEDRLDELQDIITRVQFANDECDYGMGLELGLDLFSFGHDIFQKKSIMLLTLAYELLGRKAFSEISERHLKQRTKENLYINLRGQQTV